MKREYPEAPIVGVGAAIIRRSPHAEQQVLLVRRAHEPLKGEWSLPGGAVEVGETLEEAVCREVLEETGLVVETFGVVEAFDRISRDSDGRVRFHFVLIDFLCRVKGEAESASVSCASDALEARWAGAGDLEGLTPKAIEVIRQAWRMAS